jgi:acyl-CoA hydrolase
MAEQPIGPILDGLGVTIDLDDGELVETALVVTKLVNADGQVLLGLYGPDGMSWLEKLGLIEAAKQRVTSAAWSDRNDD